MSHARVRFAPSPTGELHLGSALAALANLAFAKSGGGSFVLRVDDTDRERSTVAHVGSLLETLAWLGLAWDEGPYYQSERSAHYELPLRNLLAAGKAYFCFCDAQRLDLLAASQRAAHLPSRYDGHCRALDADDAARRVADGEPAVVRLLVQDSEWGFDDLVRGGVAAPAGSFGDYILRRSDGAWAYLFASVVDDIDLGITHVLRGEDHLPNTPRQLALFAALEAEPPRFGHLPLIMRDDGRKLSKRDPHGTVDSLREEDYEPQTIRRYLAELLGQGAVDLLGDDVEFDLARVPSTSPRLSTERLRSLAREQMSSRSPEQLRVLLAPLLDAPLDPRYDDVIADLRGEVASASELLAELRQVLDAPSQPEFTEGEVAAVAELDAYLARADIDVAAPGAGAVAHLKAEARHRSLSVRDMLQPVRRALTGQAHGPRLDAVIDAIGRDEVRSRLASALSVSHGT